jgi:uncharacterized membrane protein YoaK (UPF0700 family)
MTRWWYSLEVPILQVANHRDRHTGDPLSGWCSAATKEETHMGSHLSHRVWLLRSPTATRDALVLLLAFTAGCVDAISYVGLGNVFTSNMTGNTLLLGLALAEAQGHAVLRSLAALAGYLVGVAAGVLLIGRLGKKSLWPPTVTTILALETLILATVTLAATLFPLPSIGAGVDVIILFTAAAMGMQSVAAISLGIHGITTTYITGTWTAMMSGLVPRLSHAQKDDTEPPPLIGMQAAVVGIYPLAAVVGGIAEAHWHLLALAIPAITVAAVVAVAWLSLHRRSD